MKDSKTIVAINTDPDAPIFQVRAGREPPARIPRVRTHADRPRARAAHALDATLCAAAAVMRARRRACRVRAQVADYGIVDDLFKVCPELDQKLKAAGK